MMDLLDNETLQALDWTSVLEALAEHARTSMGAQHIRSMPFYNDRRDIHACLDQIDEVLSLEEDGETLPIGGVEDLRTYLKRAEKGEVLTGSELRQCGLSLSALRSLAWFLLSRQEQIPNLGALGNAIVIDDGVADELEVAFEPNGELSHRAFPILAELRNKVTGFHEAIRSTLDSMLRGEEMADILQDRFVTLRNDRYVLPIKTHAKRWDIGIIHGTSGSGQTAFIEPHQVVALNNKLRVAQGELAAEENRIRARLSRSFGACRQDVTIALEQAILVDLAVARRELARQLDAHRPIVSDAGTIDLKNARHPILCLRGIPVVSNDLALHASQPALLLTGPNAGGKTISLKTIGLCALLVRFGCFITAEEGSRIDFFHTILAAIGDAQTVYRDLSSFSGHLMVLNAMVQRASSGALMLLDELTSGTDPAQGAPLAQAILEVLMDKGASLVVTTHFSRLKTLPATDPRFSGSAMEYSEGKPTYRILRGALGESRALSTAERLGLDPTITQRARELMDEGEGKLSIALETLEAQRQHAEDARRETEQRAKTLAAQEERLAAREKLLQEKAKELQAQAASGFIDRIKAAERTISAVVADLQASPSHGRVQAAKASLGALKHIVPAKKEVPPLPEVPKQWAPGTPVFVRSLNAQGEVLSSQGDSVRIRVGALTTQVQRGDLEKAKPTGKKKPSHSGPPSRQKKTPKANAISDALRLPSNTLDMRGMRVDEGIDKASDFLDQCLMRDHDHAFLLHGHGTGALKQALRTWVRGSNQVQQWAPANQAQGGDAFTVIALYTP